MSLRGDPAGGRLAPSRHLRAAGGQQAHCLRTLCLRLRPLLLRCHDLGSPRVHKYVLIAFHEAVAEGAEADGGELGVLQKPEEVSEVVPSVRVQEPRSRCQAQGKGSKGSQASSSSKK